MTKCPPTKCNRSWNPKKRREKNDIFINYFNFIRNSGSEGDLEYGVMKLWNFERLKKISIVSKNLTMDFACFLRFYIKHAVGGISIRIFHQF
jgi:hypothetical protein